MSANDLLSLYREQVLAHAREPQHFGRLEDADQTVSGNNPLCGDKLSVYLRRDGNRLSAITFEGSGCAISMASASMMTEMLTDATSDHAHTQIARVREMLCTPLDAPIAPALKDTPIAALAAVRQYPSRVKCALLAWQAISGALAGETTVTTE